MNLSNEDRKWFEGLLEGTIGPLKKDVGSLRKDVNTLKGDVNTLKGDVNTLKGDIKEIKEKVNQNHKRIVFLVDRADLLRETVTDLKKNVQKLDTKTSAMNKKFENRTDQLGDETEDHERRITRIEEMAVSV